MNDYSKIALVTEFPAIESNVSKSILSRHQTLVNEGHLSPDSAQEAVILRLDELSKRIATRRLARKSSSLGWLFGRKVDAAKLKGIYIWGSVGRGKTMLMDLFFAQLDMRGKRRVHFHTFMADVHERIYQWRQSPRNSAPRDPRSKGSDPIAPVAEDLAKEAWVLCFDEFTVTDIADAMILGRLFEALWANGVVIVATSNVEPDLLYRNGLNRALFLPFIEHLKENMDIIWLDAPVDYRLEKLGGSQLYYSPADSKSRTEIEALWSRLSGGRKGNPSKLVVKTRQIDIPAALDGMARFSFEDLCNQPLGASDYLEIARNFHTLFLEEIPLLDYSRRNAAKRFITLIDILYENHVKLIASASAPAHLLYRSDEGFEAFEFERTTSRLIEMRSDEYLAHPHGSRDSEASGKITGLVET